MLDCFSCIIYNPDMQSYKFKINPTKEQSLRLDSMFGCSRFVWNYFLDLNNKAYLEAKERDLKKKHLNYYDCASQLTGLKKEHKWLKVANSQSLQQTIKDLDTAYNQFFQKKKGFPNFKSKKSKQSFRIPQMVSIKDGLLFVRKFQEGIKTIVHRPLDGKIRYATITKAKTNKYFVSITTDHEVTKQRKSDNRVGIDLGIKDFAILSNGEKYKIPTTDNTHLEYLCRQVSKKQKGSKNRDKARLRLALEYERRHNQLEDFQHKLSDKICKENELIAIEDLNVSGMIKNHCLARSISSQGWYSFVTKLEYKSKRYGGQVVKTKRFYPSSKTCNNCGFINQELTLKDREWSCPVCHTVLDRDINASRNIINQVQRELNIKGGRTCRLKPVELPTLLGAMKQEAIP